MSKQYINLQQASNVTMGKKIFLQLKKLFFFLYKILKVFNDYYYVGTIIMFEWPKCID